MTRSPRGQWRLKWRAAIGLVVVILFLWGLSFYKAGGFGLGRSRPNGPPAGTILLNNVVRYNFEVSLARGGLLLILNGSRSDVVYYDQNMGSGSSDYGLLYTIEMNGVAAPVVWWPSSIRPRPWAGRYVLVPFWMPLLGAIALVCWVWRKRPKQASICLACGYTRQGIQHTALCPECGMHPQA